MSESDRSGLVEAVAGLGQTTTGWVNVLPVIDDDVAVPPTPGIFAIFSKRGPVVPLGTWTTPELTRRGVSVAQIGIQHGTAERAAVVLRPTDSAIPPDWKVVSDHPRRGLVVEPAGDATPLDIASWLLGALAELCIPPRTGEVDVFIHGSGGS